MKRKAMEKVMYRLGEILIAIGIILFIIGVSALDSVDEGYTVAVAMSVSGVFSTCTGLLIERLF